MAGIIVVDRIESDASYASSINVASRLIVSNTTNFTSNVGFGTSSPAAAIHVSGNADIRGSGSADQLNLVGGISGNANRIQIRGALHPSTPNVLSVDLNSGEAFRVIADGALILKGGSLSATGTGITFPATQNASSNANTLDDYEEGTFTPTYLGGSSAGTTSYNDRNGFYTKIGNLVTFTIYIAPASSTGTGSIFIGGLPFAAQSGTNGDTFTVMVNALDWSAGSYIVGYLGTGGTTIVPYGCSDNAGWAALNITNASVTFYISGSYRTAT